MLALLEHTDFYSTIRPAGALRSSDTDVLFQAVKD